VVKEAFVSSQSLKDDRSLGAVELCKVREVESISFLGSNSVSPSLPMLLSFRGSKVDIVESLVSSTISTSHSLGAVELGKKVLANLFLTCRRVPLSPSLNWGILGQ
jgi:hypothetical protein